MAMDLDSCVSDLQSQEFAAAAHSTIARQSAEAGGQELKSKSATFAISDEVVTTESPKRTTAFDNSDKAVTTGCPPTSTKSIELQMSDAVSTQLPTIHQEMLQRSHESTDREMVYVQRPAESESQKREKLNTPEDFEMVDASSAGELQQQRDTSDEFIIVDLPTPYTAAGAMFSSPQTDNLSLYGGAMLVDPSTIPQYEIKSVTSSPSADTNIGSYDVGGSAMVVDTTTVPKQELKSVASSAVREVISTKHEVINGFDINGLGSPSEFGSSVSPRQLRINTAIAATVPGH